MGGCPAFFLSFVLNNRTGESFGIYPKLGSVRLEKIHFYFFVLGVTGEARRQAREIRRGAECPFRGSMAGGMGGFRVNYCKSLIGWGIEAWVGGERLG